MNSGYTHKQISILLAIILGGALLTLGVLTYTGIDRVGAACTPPSCGGGCLAKVNACGSCEGAKFGTEACGTSASTCTASEPSCGGGCAVRANCAGSCTGSDYGTTACGGTIGEGETCTASQPTCGSGCQVKVNCAGSCAGSSFGTAACVTTTTATTTTTTPGNPGNVLFAGCECKDTGFRPNGDLDFGYGGDTCLEHEGEDCACEAVGGGQDPFGTGTGSYSGGLLTPFAN